MTMESYLLEDNYGNKIEFLNSEVSLLNRSNYGAAPVQFIETSGFLQDGVSVQRFKLDRRTLTLDLFVSQNRFDSKIDYWNFRDTLNRILNPFAAPLKFTLTREDGTKRQLTNIYPNGINFVESDINWNIRETITLNVNTPYWIDAAKSSYDLSETLATGFIFPIVFPIIFGGSGASLAKEFSSDEIGTWKVYPTITITGSYGSCKLNNSWNKSEINLFVGISSAETRIINLDPSNISVTDASGNNKINELNINSNLANFYLHPNESNIISATLTGASDSTNVNISFNKTYIGI